MQNIPLLITSLNRFLFNMAKWLIYLIVPIMLIEVVSRYVFGASTVWSLELASLLFGPYFLLGGPYLLHMGGHVAVDILKERVRGPFAKVLEFAGLCLGLVFAGLLAYYAAPLAYNSFMMQETSFSSWNPVVWPFKLFLPLAGGLMFLQVLAEIMFLLNGQHPAKTEGAS
ncbi:TRAP transporter small permease subunit [Terasakiella pusilla]|uniref:TRAP transporter small permease subunit n=1 Tax=Terasakiella pusilla TaxID=64973 RepID=UPI003AA7C162